MTQPTSTVEPVGWLVFCEHRKAYVGQELGEWTEIRDDAGVFSKGDAAEAAKRCWTAYVFPVDCPFGTPEGTGSTSWSSSRATKPPPGCSRSTS